MGKLGDVLRVNAQLVATQTGAHLWADRFDMQLKELSAGQGDIARRIAQTLNVAVMDIESARSKLEHPTDPNAFDLIIRARSMYLHPMGVREYAERLALDQQALQLDAASVLALTGAASELIRLTFIGHAANELERAGALIRKAAAISPSHLAVLDATAYLLFAKGVMRWPRKIGQVSKLGSPFEKDGPDDGQTEAVCGGVQGESCS